MGEDPYRYNDSDSPFGVAIRKGAWMLVLASVPFFGDAVMKMVYRNHVPYYQQAFKWATSRNAGDSAPAKTAEKSVIVPSETTPAFARLE